MKLILIFVLGMMLFSTIGVMAVADESGKFNFDSTESFIQAIPSIDKTFKENEIIIPDSISFLIGDGNILVAIFSDNVDSNNFYITVNNKRVEGISEGIPEKSNYKVSTDREIFERILNSDDVGDSIMSAYDEDKITIKANGFSNNVKLFFAKIFINFFK